jgi:hypothetical protein
MLHYGEMRFLSKSGLLPLFVLILMDTTEREPRRAWRKAILP